MSPRRPLLSLLVLTFALASLVLGGLACGKKDKGTNPPTTHQFPLSDGAWRVTMSTSLVSGGASCPEIDPPGVDTVLVSNGQSDMFPDCTFNVTGNRFTQACSDTMVIGDNCRMIVSYSGSGSFTATTFSATYNLGLVTNGSCPTTYDCRYRVVMSGQKIAIPAPFERRRTDGRTGPAWLPRLRSR